MALAEGFGADMASYAASGVNDQNLAHRDFYLHLRRLFGAGKFGAGKSVRTLTLAHSSNFLELNCDLLSDDLDRIAAEYGYMLVMPKTEYVTWGDQRFEGSGVKPNVEVPWIPVASSDGDNQADAAVRDTTNERQMKL